MDRIIAGAVYDFVGYLTAHTGTIEVGASVEVSPLMNLFVAWAAERGLEIKDADVQGWQESLEGHNKVGDLPVRRL